MTMRFRAITYGSSDLVLGDGTVSVYSPVRRLLSGNNEQLCLEWKACIEVQRVQIMLAVVVALRYDVGGVVCLQDWTDVRRFWVEWRSSGKGEELEGVGARCLLTVFEMSLESKIETVSYLS